MSRVKRGFVAKKRRQKILNFTKGFVGSHSKLFRSANQQAMKSLRYSYFDRRKKKNDLRKIWISRINAISKSNNGKYNQTIKKLKVLKINLNRKILSKICLIDKKTFLTFYK